MMHSKARPISATDGSLLLAAAAPLATSHPPPLTQRNQLSSESGRRSFFALGLVLQNARHDDGPDQRQEPDELALRDLLRSIEELGAPNPLRHARLKPEHYQDHENAEPLHHE